MTRGFAAIGLYAPRKEVNVAGALRAAGCFAADLLVIQGGRAFGGAANTAKTERHIPVVLTDDLLSVQPYGSTLVVVELLEGARPLTTFRHPQQAYYVFGPENGSVPPHVVAATPLVVYVPTAGCMNLAATVNVVLYDRLSKQGRAA